MKKKCFSHQ